MLPVLPRYVHGPIGAGDVAVGIVIGCYAISGLMLRPVAGRLADRWGRRPTAVLGLLFLAAGGLLFPALGLAGLIFARLVLGVGEGFLYTATSAWVVDMAPVARRGRILGLFGLAVWGGLGVGPLFGELLLQQSGYRAVWTLATVLPALGRGHRRLHDRSLPAAPPRRAAPADRARGGPPRRRGRPRRGRLRDDRRLHRADPGSARRSATGRPCSPPSRR